jgi:hypothetical protein
MFTARHTLVITTPEGKVKRHKAFRVYIGENRVTWITLDGVRHYVLLRHGFTYVSENY